MNQLCWRLLSSPLPPLRPHPSARQRAKALEERSMNNINVAQIHVYIGATKVSPKIRHDVNTMATCAKLDDDRPASRKEDAMGSRTTQPRKPCGIAQFGNLGDRPGTSEQLLFATNVTECPAREPGTRLDFNGPKRQFFVDKPRGNPCLGTPKPHFGEEVLRNCPIWEPWEPWEPVGNRLGTSGRRFFATSIRESPVWEPWDPFRHLKF